MKSEEDILQKKNCIFKNVENSKTSSFNVCPEQLGKESFEYIVEAPNYYVNEYFGR